MRLSTSTCMYYNRPDGSKMEYKDCIKGLYDAGYRVLDMNFHDASVFKAPFVGNGWEKWTHELADYARELGIEFSQSHAHFYNYCNDGPDNEYLETLVKRSVLASEIMGIPWTTIHAATDVESATPMKASREKGIEYFKRLSDYAAEHNVGLAIENLWELNISPQRRYTANAEELMDLVDAIDRENVGVCWDAEHSLIMHQDTKKVLSLMGPKLKNTHISDYVHTFHDHILPWEGIADWDEIMDGFAALDDYEGDFTYEVHRFTMRMPDWAIPAALRYSYELGCGIVDEIERRRKNVAR